MLHLHFDWDWKAALTAVVIYILAVVALVIAVRTGGREADAMDVRDVEGAPGDREEMNRPDPLGEAARSSQAWRAELLSSLDDAPARHAPLGLAGRMLAAVARIMRSPTRENPVVVVEPETDEEPEVPEPFDPLTSPIDVPAEPVDTWALLNQPRPGWVDQSFTEQWEALTPERLAVMDEQARHDAAALLTDVTA